MAAEDRTLEQSRRTWHTFCRIMLYVIIAAVIVLGGMRLFLV
jgi:hypothetical protein